MVPIIGNTSRLTFLAPLQKTDGGVPVPILFLVVAFPCSGRTRLVQRHTLRKHLKKATGLVGEAVRSVNSSVHRDVANLAASPRIAFACSFICLKSASFRGILRE
jgi:hypothetical protein